VKKMDIRETPDSMKIEFKKVEEEILKDLFCLFKKQTIIRITHSPVVAHWFDRIKITFTNIIKKGYTEF
jgi:ABC-type transport system involved in cytochrome bd biosynthesis fused ATPase/permease subunit